MNQPPKILIVEDQYLVAIDCEDQLQQAGYECIGLASTRAEAVSLAHRQHPDLVIMDIHLGGVGASCDDDGLSAAIEIYEQLGIRCLFASAHANSTMRQVVSHAYPLGWLDKPYSAEGLLIAVVTAIAELQRTGNPMRH